MAAIDPTTLQPPSGGNATFVYRGQLHVELSRIRFLLAATCSAFQEVDVVLLSPGVGASEAEVEDFGRSFPNVRRISFIAAERFSAARVRRDLREVISADARAVIGVGFSVGAYLPGRTCAVWCVNGIPEERLLHGDTVRNRLAVWLAWRSAGRVKASRTIVVSEPMADLIKNRCGGTPVVVPNAVDTAVFCSDPNVLPKFLTYEGGGSPWQGLDRLAAVWKELHRIDPSLRFRVITQDDRAKQLANSVPPAVVEVRSTSDHHEVAELLQEARLGFLIRAPGVVNRVSWPMKLGEYLGAGAPVVVSRCGWDAERLVETFAAGLVIDWSDAPEVTATSISRYLTAIGSGRPPGVELAAAELDAQRWIVLLREALEFGVMETLGRDVERDR